MTLRKFFIPFAIVLSIFIAIMSCSGRNDAGSTFPTVDAFIDQNLDAHDALDTSIVDASMEISVGDASYNWWPAYPGPIKYNSGDVMTGTVNVYILWYGSWLTSSQTDLIERLIGNFSSTAYSRILTDYYEHPNVDAGLVKTTYVTGDIKLVKSAYLGYSYGTALHSGDVESILTDALQKSIVPYDEGAVYFVLTSSDITEVSGFSSFCGDYYGWHDDYVVQGKSIKVAFVGDPSGCLENCTIKSVFDTNGILQSPNNDWGMDGMASVIVHELFETITDPHPMGQKAWQDLSGYENGDMCAWRFEPTFKTMNGKSRANIDVGGSEYIVQQMWVLDETASGSGNCAMQR